MFRSYKHKPSYFTLICFDLIGFHVNITQMLTYIIVCWVKEMFLCLIDISIYWNVQNKEIWKNFDWYKFAYIKTRSGKLIFVRLSNYQFLSTSRFLVKLNEEVMKVFYYFSLIYTTLIALIKVICFSLWNASRSVKNNVSSKSISRVFSSIRWRTEKNVLLFVYVKKVDDWLIFLFC